MSEIQDELQKKNREILELLGYFHENFNEEVAIIRELKSISNRIIVIMNEDAKNESGQH